VLGASFGWKFCLALLQGKVAYFPGFLPIKILSPFILHTSVRTSPFIKEAGGWWVRLLIAPVFLIISLLLLSGGSDFLGWPGTKTLNYLFGLAGAKGDAIHFNPKIGPGFGWRFPIFTKNY